jgi:hypothetical protein
MGAAGGHLAVRRADPAGIVGLVLCALALCAAAAPAIEDARRRTVLPLGRRGGGAASVGGGPDEQLERLEREAGVREAALSARPAGGRCAPARHSG